jgi:adenylylsulfate kinase
LKVEVLDGDDVRNNLGPELGFSKQERELHAKRVSCVSRLLSRNGIITIVAYFPIQIIHHARNIIGKDFVEVWVKASIEICRQRDPKGIY